jgi:ABC-2 type transport system permease protein/oleandomycin transport system permease protein
MTAVTAPPLGTRARWAVSDGFAVMGRNLLHWVRQPRLLVFSTIQPVMFVLLFNYVFGGAIPVANYTNFLLPGVFVQAVTFGATQTAIGLAEDLAGGMIDRFKSLPMARSAVLLGRTLSDLARNLFVVLLMTVVGYAVGFRFTGGFAAAVGAILVIAGLSFVLSWVYAFVGLSVPNAETAQAASFVVTFPMVFASSAFVPIETMPSWLQAFARITPITATVDSARALALGLPLGNSLVLAVGWMVLLLAVFAPLAVARFRRAG